MFNVKSLLQLQIVGVAMLLAVIVAVAFGALMALPVMWLWNYAAVGNIAGLSEINYLHAWGLYILCNILFKSTSSKSGD